MGKSNSPPARHHYLPIFYLKRWTLSDGRLCQLSRPFGSRVVPNRRHPSATGFHDRLYEFRNLDGTPNAMFEEHFFAPADGDAADALALMEQKAGAGDWTRRTRSGWSRFLHSLLLRFPEDQETLRELWRIKLEEDAEGEWERRYQAERDPSHPETFRGFISSLTEESLQASRLRALVGMIDGQGLGEKMNRLVWYVLPTPQAKHELLTSDRPVIRSNGMQAENGHLALAIGPRRLFIAARDHNVLRGILALGQQTLTREYNRHVVEGAARFVYGTDDAQLRFVQNRMGRTPQRRMLENILANARAAQLAGNSPAPDGSSPMSSRSISSNSSS